MGGSFTSLSCNEISLLLPPKALAVSSLFLLNFCIVPYSCFFVDFSNQQHWQGCALWFQ